MKINYILSYICFLLLSLVTGSAQEIIFNHLTSEEGLSNNSVMGLYQDSKGFIWIATRNGVNLYNGNSFTVFKYRKNDSNSIIYNSAKEIIGNEKDELYIMTPKGISTFDFSRKQFATLIRGNTRSMFYHQQLYVGLDHNLYRHNGKLFDLFYSSPDIQSNISAIYACDDFTLFGTEKQGLFKLDKSKRLSHLIKNENITNIFKDSTGKFWVGTWDTGIYRIDGNEITNFRHSVNDSFSISSDFGRCFCEDMEGNIWVGTFNGLNCFNPSTQRFTRYRMLEKEKGLTHSSIWSLLCDRQGTIWVGTYFGGINYFNPKRQIYQHFQTSRMESSGLSSSIVGCITEDDQNQLWICTEGGGVNRWNMTNGTFKWYKHSDSSNSLSHDNVKSIYYDKQRKCLWIGTHTGGLNKLDVFTEKITHYRMKEGEEESLPSNTIRDIIPYKDHLLLATHGGVCQFNPNNGKSQLMFQNEMDNMNFMSTLCLDHRGVLWLSGNGQGIYAYDFDTRKLKKYKHNHALGQSVSSNSISRIYEDSQKRLWFCTNESGVDLYRYETDDFENFDEQRNGLESNCIYDMCELSPDKLLFTTDVGFSILDYPTRIFTNYNKKNGVPLSTPNERSLYRAKSGEIFVGGIDGMISFREEEINGIPQKYSIYPFRLIVNGEEVFENDKSNILTQALADTPKLVLSSGQSMLSIEYAVLNYMPSYKDDIEYCLKGFSDRWTSMRGQNTITYTNLNPGIYTLIVRATNNLFVPESRLEIEVLPPAYRTNWAYFLYLSIAGGLLYCLIRTYKSRIKLQESLKYEKKQAEDIERMNQAKLRFFTNISHEFRTPLTLIIGQVEMLLQVRSFAPLIYNRVLGVYKHSLQLRELITELLDFRKQEQGFMTIKVSEHNIIDFISENCLLFQEYAAQRQITFNFQKSSDVVNVWYDTKQMQKVMNNLLSNAFKYTQEGGTITVFVRKSNREVIIEVTDNGIGIPSKDIDYIFTRFYQTEQLGSFSYVGSGIGLALTKGIIELHHGSIEVYSDPRETTVFSIHLKLGKEHFTSEQINEQTNESQLMIEEHRAVSETQLQLIMEQEIINSEKMENNKTAKMLIVEDNEDLREMLVDIFDVFYQIITASDGNEAWEKAQFEQPDIVLSDVVMPEMSGTELCKLIKENMDTCHIPVVLLTARTAIEYNLEGLRLGADDYITKPFNVNILTSRCNNLVNNRIMLQEKFSKQPMSTHQILATNGLDKKFIDEAMRVIEKHMGDVYFNVDILAKEMGVARTKLFVKLKAISGQTPYDFILTVRLKRAAIMLKEAPELNVSEISDQSGFSSPRQFSKCFKEKYHLVPQAYRRGSPCDYANEEEKPKE